MNGAQLVHELGPNLGTAILHNLSQLSTQLSHAENLILNIMLDSPF